MSAAVHHILRQMQRDARLAWLIGPGSRTYELLTEEAATANGLDLEELRQQHEATLKFEPWPTELRVEIDPDTIMLAPPEESRVRWYSHANGYIKGEGFHISRHHCDICAPYWVAQETRKDVHSYEMWRGPYRLYVPDNFGDLVEVPAP